MLDDNEILKYLGLELQDQSIIFYDNQSEKHLINLADIKEISFDKAFTPIQTKFGFWINKLFVNKHSFGVRDDKTLMEDYRNIYELEIELKENRVLSRKVKGINPNEVEEFIENLNKLLNTSGSS